jgi:hypothetical protein
MSEYVATFGSSKAGLATVGYRWLDAAGAVIGSRATANVTNPAGSIYRADLTAPGTAAAIMWDTGDASPQYAAEAITTTSGGTGLTAQQTRDAMKLAPSTGTAASGSVDDLIGDVLTIAQGYAGAGNILVNHNTGGTDALRVTSGGAAVAGATVRAYLKSEYDAGTFTIRGTTTTNTDGRWQTPMYLSAGTYTLTAAATGLITQAKTVTVA